MFKVTGTGGHHRHAIPVTELHRFRVANGATGVYHGRDTCLARDLHTIRKREKRVARHDRPVQVEAKAVRLLDSLLQRIYP